MRRSIKTLITAVLLGTAALAQTDPVAPAPVPTTLITAHISEVDRALEEIRRFLEGQLDCGAPEVWAVKGSLEMAAETLSSELNSRGWTVMQQGQIGGNYVLLIDPNPEDPAAYVLGGLIENGGPDSHYTFLAECRLSAYGPPADQTARR
ncbi:MAG: hypothetical protein SFU83_20040 [Meiothermus sp.]|nr:hypothetical protein [Meiothermus sp.]